MIWLPNYWLLLSSRSLIIQRLNDLMLFSLLWSSIHLIWIPGYSLEMRPPSDLSAWDYRYSVLIIKDVCRINSHVNIFVVLYRTIVMSSLRRDVRCLAGIPERVIPYLLAWNSSRSDLWNIKGFQIYLLFHRFVCALINR